MARVVVSSSMEKYIAAASRCAAASHHVVTGVPHPASQQRARGSELTRRHIETALRSDVGPSALTHVANHKFEVTLIVKCRLSCVCQVCRDGGAVAPTTLGC